MWPKVSIIWLNYNSSRIMSIVLESLESVAGLDYPPDKYELIVVDNGSVDGSFERIKDFLDKNEGLRKKVIRLDRNLGFAGGNNVGFKARDRDGKYVLLLNNDAVLLQGGLKTLVEYAENRADVAGLQGVILKYGTRLIDGAGAFVDELLIPYHLGGYHEYPWILRKSIYVTYNNGACALYRVKAVEECLGSKLFIDEFFAYGDDDVLGLMLWNYGYKSIAIPEAVASHVGGLTIRKGLGPMSYYLTVRSRIALSSITNTRYRQVLLVQMLRNLLTSPLKAGLKGGQAVARAIVDGLRLGEKLRRRGSS